MNETVGSEFHKGDVVWQIGLLGLAPLMDFVHVIDVNGEGMELSRTEDGPPITDLIGKPRRYPPRVFRRV